MIGKQDKIQKHTAVCALLFIGLPLTIECGFLPPLEPPFCPSFLASNVQVRYFEIPDLSFLITVKDRYE